MRRVGGVLAGAAAALLAYLAFWPVPVEPRAWRAEPFAGYVGIHAPNSRLGKLTSVGLGNESGPEHIAFGPDGKLYTTLASGNIVRMNADGGEQEIFANTAGRVLGFDFDSAGNLIAADAFRGLLSIAPDRSIRVLADHVGNDPIRYADAVVVAKSGKLYFTDASMRFAPAQWGGTFAASFLDILEQSATGRVLEYDPRTKATRVLVGGLSFANGVALSQDERYLFVNETGKYRVWKIAVSAQALDLGSSNVVNATLASVLLENLPGFPDNLMRGRDGRIWLGFAKPRSPVIDALSDWPRVRAMLLRLPKIFWPVPRSYGHVIAFAEDGRIVADLQDPAGHYPETTAITETADRLYVQSLHAPLLGWLSAREFDEGQKKTSETSPGG